MAGRRLGPLTALGVAAACAVAATAFAAPPGAVRGAFSIGTLASFDELSQYISGRDVWCVWRGDHVFVHVTVRNRSVEHVTATIKPRYYIRNGGEHGSSFLGAKDFGFNAGQTRSLLIDAGKPKGVRARTPIGRCAPYLFLIESG